MKELGKNHAKEKQHVFDGVDILFTVYQKWTDSSFDSEMSDDAEKRVQSYDDRTNVHFLPLMMKLNIINTTNYWHLKINVCYSRISDFE